MHKLNRELNVCVENACNERNDKCTLSVSRIKRIINAKCFVFLCTQANKPAASPQRNAKTRWRRMVYHNLTRVEVLWQLKHVVTDV